MSVCAASRFILHIQHVCFFGHRPGMFQLRKSFLKTLLANSLYQTPFGDHEWCAPHVVHHVARFPEGVLVLSSAVSRHGAALSVSLARVPFRSFCIPAIDKQRCLPCCTAALSCLTFRAPPMCKYTSDSASNHHCTRLLCYHVLLVDFRLHVSGICFAICISLAFVLSYVL